MFPSTELPPRMSEFPQAEWIESAVGALEDDAWFGELLEEADASVLFAFGDREYHATFSDGKAEFVDQPEFAETDFALRAPVDVWEAMFAEEPEPMYQDIMATWLQTRELIIDGDIRLALQHLHLLKRIVTVFRQVAVGSADVPASLPDDVPVDDGFAHGEQEAIEGRYVWIEHGGKRYRTYYETAGDGDVPLVCLHTASGDSRQWRHVLNDEVVTENYTVYAFDMPWHGHTFPPLETEWWIEGHSLSTEFYVGFVMSFVDALELDQPAVLGCSMGGTICLPLAAQHQDALRAVIALEGADRPDEAIGDSRVTRHDMAARYLDRGDLNQEVLRPGWTYALQAPQSPEKRKRESWWIYTQGGNGVYTGDLDVVQDFAVDLDRIDTDVCDVYLLTGEYDFSVTAEATRATGEQIDGAHVQIMDGMGHFPTTENPEAFQAYLHPVLESIAQ